jgi:integrase
MSAKAWSMSWSAKDSQFFARYRRVDGSGWGTKRIPKTAAPNRAQQLSAERWMIDWYAKYAATGGVAVDVAKVRPVARTLSLLVPRWLKYRHDDPGTAINTHREAAKTAHAWILDNPEFPHYSIQDLDMETDFSAEVCLAWIRSLRGNGSTPLRYAQLARTIFEDCIAHGWLPPDMANPFRRPIVQKEFRRLHALATEHRVITYLEPEYVSQLLTRRSSKVLDYRRVRYVLALATGMRDKEIQGLVWSDVRLESDVPYIHIERQLFKPGVKPFVRYEDLRDAGKSKTEMVRIEQALTTDPKRKSKRDIPLLPLAVEVLKHWKRYGWHQWVGFAPKEDDPVFPGGRQQGHEPSNRFSVVASPGLLRMDLGRLGIPTKFDGHDIVFHSLRHTFATMLEAGGVDRSMIGDLLGHKAQSVTRAHYIAPLLAVRAQAVSKLQLPDAVQLKGVLVRADAKREGELIVLRDRKPREWLRKRNAKRKAATSRDIGKG